MNTQLLAEALRDAATSLETINRLAGRAAYLGDDGEKIPTYMEHHDQVRGYAHSRAQAAREALAAFEASGPDAGEAGELPPLPEPEGVIVVGTQALRAFTADQMHAYAIRCIAATMPQGLITQDDLKFARAALATPPLQEPSADPRVLVVPNGDGTFKAFFPEDAALGQDKKDAERYRYLRKWVKPGFLLQDDPRRPLCGRGALIISVPAYPYVGGGAKTPEDLDSCIDGAIQMKSIKSGTW